VATIHPSIPASVSRLVVNVISPLGKAPIGSPVVVPPIDPGNEAWLFAADSSDNIILASMLSSNGQGKTFTVTSTAVALTRLSLGSLPSGVDAVKMDTAIKSAPEFSNLVSLINKAFAAGSPPASYPGVALSLTTVLGQALPTAVPQAAH